LLNPIRIIGGLAAIAVLAVGAFAVWFLFLRDDGPEEVSTDSALEALERRTATAAAGNTPGSSSNTPAASTSDGLEGNWVVEQSADSFAGYRVQEELVTIGGTTAVGRTSNVTGGFSVTGNRTSEATITVDMTTLRSQESLRDGQLRNQGIEFGRFPTSTFTLDPTDIPESVERGETTPILLTGQLTLHGVTRDIEIPAEVTFRDGILVVVGQVDIQFADYDIEKPTSVRVASIEDHGIMEIQLLFTRS
jgi:polyisoprenoid-binding protein YceI